MPLTVIRFSQEASLEDPSDMQNFLVLKGSTSEIRILVSAEDMKKVIQAAYSTEKIEEPMSKSEQVDELWEPQEHKEELHIQENGIEAHSTDGGVSWNYNKLAQSVDEDGVESL